MDLDPKEMEALLGDQQDGKGAPSQTVSSPVSDYDLCNPQVFNRAELSRIETCLSNFCRPLVAHLQSHLALPIAVELLDVRVTALRAVLESRPENDHVTRFRVGSGSSPAEVVWNGGFLALVVDRLMGGEGVVDESFVPTPIAQRIADLLTEALFTKVDEAFVQLLDLHTRWPTPADIELSRRVGLSDSIQLLRADFGVEGGEWNSRLVFHFPVDDIRIKVNVEEAEKSSERSSKEVQAGLPLFVATPLSISVRLGEGVISGSDLLDLKAGDVFLLDRNVGDSVDVAVEDHIVFAASLGRDGKKIAVQIRAGDAEKADGPPLVK